MVRLDSGNDSIDNVAVLIDTGCSFIIKRNLRKENKEEWFQMAKTYCKDITTPREGKTVYVGSNWKEVTSKRFEKDFTLRAGYEITERTIDKKGQFLLPIMSSPKSLNFRLFFKFLPRKTEQKMYDSHCILY